MLRLTISTERAYGTCGRHPTAGLDEEIHNRQPAGVQPRTVDLAKKHPVRADKIDNCAHDFRTIGKYT
jgi:hypothetical protein